MLIGVRAVSLNYRDLLIARASYGKSGKPVGLVPVSDGAGEVIAVGEKVTRFKLGDRVAGAFMPGWVDGDYTAEKRATSLGGGTADGMLREKIALPEHGVLHLPEHLSFEEGATLPCAGLTAWYALFEGADVKPGNTVLLLGTGGVSIFSLQFAKSAGARVIITSSSDEKLKRARTLGADETINYKTTPDWHHEVRRLTGGIGADHAVEVGGAGTLNKTMAALRYSGSLALMGALTGLVSEVDTGMLHGKNIRIQGTYVGSVAMFERMNRAISAIGLKPVIDRVFAFEQAVEAYDYLASGQHFGKVVIRI